MITKPYIFQAVDTFQEALSSLTRKELEALVADIDIRGVSNINKATYIQMLELLFMDEKQVESKQEDFNIALRSLSAQALDDETLKRKALELFCALGYGSVKETKQKITITYVDAIYEHFHPQGVVVDENDPTMRKVLIEKFLEACVNFYGICEIPSVLQLFTTYHPDMAPLSLPELKAAMEMMPYYGRSFFLTKKFLLHGNFADNVLGGLDVNHFCLDAHWQNASYLILAAEDFRQYYDPFFVPVTPELTRLRKLFYSELAMNQEDIHDLVDEFAMMIRMDLALDFWDVLENFGANLDDDKFVLAIEGAIHALTLRTHLWLKRGHYL